MLTIPDPIRRLDGYGEDRISCKGPAKAVVGYGENQREIDVPPGNFTIERQHRMKGDYYALATRSDGKAKCAVAPDFASALADALAQFGEAA